MDCEELAEALLAESWSCVGAGMPRAVDDRTALVEWLSEMVTEKWLCLFSRSSTALCPPLRANNCRCTTA